MYWFTKSAKNNPVAMAKLSKPVNASAAEIALVKIRTYMSVTNSCKSLCAKKMGLPKLYP
jgi:hypothetical protein